MLHPYYLFFAKITFLFYTCKCFSLFNTLPYKGYWVSAFLQKANHTYRRISFSSLVQLFSLISSSTDNILFKFRKFKAQRIFSVDSW